MNGMSSTMPSLSLFVLRSSKDSENFFGGLMGECL